ncbi:23S rRNA (uracil(1939)-C(5))-methyltransferase RlmD [Alicyclobacillus dauci]|uniref:23S rRNA (Uracil(1939)-C(5))-methyltransferase RlmD n=1 Tax=Alicyclobacillus dauci TaxID=1475485 RepID=A0ABY6Z1I2_9BACL|nr:23S rRNA (uracil(1939)-C(5))-methyltransferase RlmD [Alicyclobacillus dauci]WAH36448.1 23S rRNA (uracil(1939)-C(5))-methyltransferase RlmD [Alicyclobacillus dauci]
MPDSKLDHPVQAGGTYDVTAIRLNDDGDGVATVNGFTVFVPYLLPGERATVRITDRQRRFARALLLERHSTSPDRQDAPCPVFGECGGCQVQHLTYEGQLEWKTSRIARVAKQVGLDADKVVRPIIGSDEPFRYRNQVQMPFRYNSDEKSVEMGFYGAATHDLIPTDSCHLQSETMQETLNEARKFLEGVGPDIASLVHHVIVRESAANGEQVVVFAVFRKPEALRAALKTFDAPRAVTTAVTVQPKLGGPVWGRTVETMKGSGTLIEEISGIPFRVSPRSFLQVQTGMAERMYETVREYAALKSDDTVIDAYCGIGTMTLMLAKESGRAVGIEEIASAVSDARVNRDDNGIENAEFIAGRVEEWMPKWVEDGGHADVVVFDPPRKGIDAAALSAVIEAKPRRIVYASCNPATLQRDLKGLLAGGYKVEAMQPFDMFPQTSHVECVVSTYLAD